MPQNVLIEQERTVPIISTDDVFSNSRGYLRVALVRKHFGLHYLDDSKVLIQTQKLTKSKLEDITRLYVNWRDFCEYMPMRFKYKQPTFKDLGGSPVCPDKWIDRYMESSGLFAVRFNEFSDIVSYEHYVYDWRCPQASKRGNSVYVDIVSSKLKPLLASTDHKKFFSTKLNKARKRVRRTKLLYLTGTCDPSTTGDLSKSWLSFGSYWNKFIANIRSQFGKAVYIRAWQSQENGYPHFHALIYFYGQEFTATKWKEKDGRISWRVHNRQKLDKGDKITIRDRLKGAWKYGHLDVKCCDDSKKALRDVIKYITSDLKGGESDLTNAMVWYFGKQSYSISKGFCELFGVDNVKAEPSVDDLINASGVIKSNNSNSSLVEIGIFPLSGSQVFSKNGRKLVQNSLFCDFEVKEDPPPGLILDIDYLDSMVDECEEVSSRYRDDGVKVVVFDWKREYGGF